MQTYIQKSVDQHFLEANLYIYDEEKGVYFIKEHGGALWEKCQQEPLYRYPDDKGHWGP